MHPTLRRFLEEGGTVVTVNARLARSLAGAFGQAARSAGEEAWLRPDVISYAAWLSRWWDQLTAAPPAGGRAPRMLLGRAAETVLWESIIAADEESRPILQPARTAELARRAHATALRWHVTFEGASYSWTEDVQAFARWKRRFDEVCEERGYLTPASVPGLLTERVKSGAAELPDRILLAGFDEVAPLDALLFETLSGAGVTVSRWSWPRHEPDARLLAADDAETELRVCARWARRKLESSDGEAVSIGVIVPDLAACRGLVERVFTEVFYPGAVCEAVDAADRAFNLSAARPLASYPVVDAAFQALNLLQDALSWEDAGRLVRSPFLAGGLSEREARSLFDARLRRRGVLTVTRQQLQHMAAHFAERDGDTRFACPILARRLASAAERAGDTRALRPPSRWKRVFLDVLRAMGWPGDRKAGSEEHQALASLRESLSRFSALDEVSGSLSCRSALSRLHRMCSEEPFQPKTGAAPVQIMGVLEAGGLSFDHLWISGLHDEEWPEKPSPNPFLPLDQQKKKNVPHASAERELEFCRLVTDRLLHAAPEIVVSYPARVEDRELKPSRLVSALPPIPAGELDLYEYASPAQIFAGSADLEEAADFRAPPIEDGTAVRGGSKVFELQAKCPFRAYAEIRLNAECLETPTGGFDAREKGVLVHRALQKLWERIGSHEALVHLADAERVVQEAVAEALQERREKRPECYADRFAEVEQSRLRRLLSVLLDAERRRRPFTVTNRELRRPAGAGGLTVTTVVDRIDTLDDGRQVFIDYKTGSPKLKSWLGDRPDEPQLPLYALTSGADVAAVAFVQVNAEGVAFCGFQRDAGTAPGLTLPDGRYRRPESWDELIEGWRRALDTLGREHREGEARVDPKDPSGTCRYCPQTAFCRKHELLAFSAEEENGEE